MTEEAWGSDFDQPVKKKSALPILAWVFGSGCLLVILVLIVGGFFFARFMNKSTDPDIQWPRVAEVLPFDERPSDLEIFGFGIGGDRTWMITLPDQNHRVLLTHITGSGIAEQRKMLFGGSEGFTIEVQGRELTAMRPESGETDETEPSFGDVLGKLTGGHSIRVDLSPRDGNELVMLQFTVVDAEDAIPEQLVIDFLDRFQVDRMP